MFVDVIIYSMQSIDIDTANFSLLIHIYIHTYQTSLNCKYRAGQILETRVLPKTGRTSPMCCSRRNSQSPGLKTKRRIYVNIYKIIFYVYIHAYIHTVHIHTYKPCINTGIIIKTALYIISTCVSVYAYIHTYIH